MAIIPTLSKKPRSAQFARTQEDGLHATIVQREGLREFHITLRGRPTDKIENLITRLHAFVTANRARVVRQESFGMSSVLAEIPRLLTARFGKVDWPITSVEARPSGHGEFAGLHVFAVAGTEVETLDGKDGNVGVVFSDGVARHCLLGDVIPAVFSAGRGEQTSQVFHRMARYLRDSDMDFTNIARTWLFLEDILDWYDLFNKERREIFELYDVFSHCVPASTGIGARNVHRTALTAGAWAVQPLTDSVTIHPVESPLQCSARDYGSCFSRAVEIDAPDLRRLFISGTASIAPDGRTEYVGDIRRQVMRTMEVVEAILCARGMHWKAVNRATVYLKRAGYASAFAEYQGEHDLQFPAIGMEAVVCRDDLLFEIEVDAMTGSAGKPLRHWEI